MSLSEAEIQVLSSLKEAENEGQPTDRATLEQRSKRYWIFKEDWSEAFPSLANKQFINVSDSSYSLTESGRPLAEAYYAERPDLYWYYYQHFYSIAEKSKTHSKFCEQVFGKDLAQEGQTDMECLNDILSQLAIKPGQRVLDLGCGAGGLSEYIADHTGAIVTGVDYSTSAIETANSRTKSKRDRLTFVEGDLNDLGLQENSFDVAISIDSIYWVADTAKAISSIAKSILPGGKLCILIEHRKIGKVTPQANEADKTDVALALSELNLHYEVKDYTEHFLRFWPRVKEVALALKEDYEREDASLICDNWIREADDIYLPAVNANEIVRYLYTVSL